ncbi:hypothetical protein A2U01_0060375, partial [Trifolium medium]|nr:hypothetical protein [Trifolium medium]
MPKLLVSVLDVMTGVRISVTPLCV